MNLENYEIQNWLQKTFSAEDLKVGQIQARLADLQQLEGSDLSLFVYELAQVHSLAAFLLWYQAQQQSLQNWAHKVPLPTGKSMAVSSLAPIFHEEKAPVFLLQGKGLRGQLSVERPSAFRELQWAQVRATPVLDFSYDEKTLQPHLQEQITYLGALVAGLKKALYAEALKYSQQRIQGGKVIQAWSEVQSILSRLYIQTTRDESHLKDLSFVLALDILDGADQFASLAMQVFGGAGYTEDFKAEKYFRECVFLKNWLMPLRQAQMQFFSREVLSRGPA